MARLVGGFTGHIFENQTKMLRLSLTRFFELPKAFRQQGIFHHLVRHRKNAPSSVFSPYSPPSSPTRNSAVLTHAQSGGTERFEVPRPDHGYHEFQRDRDLVMKRLLEDPNRFQKIAEREDRMISSVAEFQSNFDGRYFIFHRGIDLLKGCHDIVIYMQLLGHVKPATIIEIGAASGGTTIWMADMLKLMDIECNIYSMDIDLTLLHDRVKKFQPPNVKFIQGDSYKVEEALTPELLHTLPHPWIVIEDAHENFPDILKYFHTYMQVGDYFIVDDTNPHSFITTGMRKVYPDCKGEWGPGKLNWLRRFLTEHNQYYAVDSFFTDLFGYNVTTNWNGFIRRMC